MALQTEVGALQLHLEQCLDPAALVGRLGWGCGGGPMGCWQRQKLRGAEVLGFCFAAAAWLLPKVQLYINVSCASIPLAAVAGPGAVARGAGRGFVLMHDQVQYGPASHGGAHHSQK